jgi:hypothetical protein
VKSARGLGEKLRIHTPALKAVGIKIFFDPIRHNDGYHVMIKTVGETCSQPSQRSQTQQPCNLPNVGIGEHREHRERLSQTVSGISPNNGDAPIYEVEL